MPSHTSTQAVNPGQLIAAGDRRIRCYEEGTGSPVVIVAGAGDCADSWLPVRRQLAASRRVLSYDRAGIGGSGKAAGRALTAMLGIP